MKPEQGGCFPSCSVLPCTIWAKMAMSAKAMGSQKMKEGKKKHQMQSVKTFHFGNYGTILGVSF